MNIKIYLAHEIARNAHKGQKDRAGVDYINHPEYVADHVDGDKEKIVAYLHDVLEDTSCTEEKIRDMFGDEIADAVVAMTHRKGEETYFEYVRRVKENALARVVKMADLRHNSQIERIKNPTEKDFKRIDKYKKALEILEAE